MGHIVLKDSSKIKLAEGVEIKSQKIGQHPIMPNLDMLYFTDNKLSDDYGFQIMIQVDNHVMSAFDYIFDGKKVIIPEVNPSLIFFSNAQMLLEKLIEYRTKLLINSPLANSIENAIVDHKLFGHYFQYATNFIFNLQCAIENFLNYSIRDHEILSEKGNIIQRPNIFQKIDFGIVQVKNLDFGSHDIDKLNSVKELISLRNKIIHLKPDVNTMSKYKDVYREVLDLNYNQSLNCVKGFMNFYEPNLVEECSCGKNYILDIIYD